MRRSIISLVIGLALVGAGSGLPNAHARRQGQGAWDRLLTAVGLTRTTCRFDSLALGMYGGGEHRLPFFEAMFHDPLRVPFYSRITRQGLVATGGKLGPLLSLAALRTGDGTRIDLLGDPLQAEIEASKKPAPLLPAVRAIYALGNTALPAAEAKRIESTAASLPAPVQQAAALLLRASARAARWRNRALIGVPAEQKAALFRFSAAPPSDEDDGSSPVEALLKSVDRKRMLVGAELLAFALDRASGLLAGAPPSRFTLDFDTPLGRVCVRGSSSDTYPSSVPYLLIVDTGGDDVYRGGAATRSPTSPVSLIVDVAGNDRYVETADLDASAIAGLAGRKARKRVPAFGCGILGYGMLLDLAGNDTYRAVGATQGRGFFGAGLLADLSGDDAYDCHTAGQGSAGAGVGILADLGGRDTYRCFTTSQGFGETRGCGILADFGEDGDLFEANDTVIDFPSPQTAQHNANLAQGAAYGRRADYSDGHSLAGGVGILMDSGGANRFTCGLFGQGAGYWYGVGMLLSGPGRDTYEGQWYVQASAAHFAVGVLDDAGGDDSYQAGMNMAQGAGHDFSVGFLVDHAGNDRYTAPNLSLGGGNANGFGFFWDRRGDDRYDVRPSTTLGRASVEASSVGSIRERNLTLGLFLDTGGSDIYPAAIAGVGNNRQWNMRDTGSPPSPSSTRGAGIDVEDPQTPEPP